MMAKEEGQTIQWPKETGQKDKQRSTKHTHKTKDRVTRTSLKFRGELRCSGRVISSCSTSGIRRVNLITMFIHTYGLWYGNYFKLVLSESINIQRYTRINYIQLLQLKEDN